MKSISNILLLFLTLLNVSWAAFLNLYCGDINRFVTASLEDPLPLLDSECFNKDLKTVVYTFGFTSNSNANTTKAVIHSYIALGGYNVFLVDWEKEAGSSGLFYKPLSYSSSVVNTKKVGALCGLALNIMSDSKLNLDTTHLIGHSLGAHFVGYCALQLQEFGKNASRLTGLDPAGPLFSKHILLDGVRPSSAAFVDVIHTNPGVLGTTERYGQVDTWVNCADKYQPQCENVTLAHKDSCSHQYACFFYADALLHPTSYAAKPCESCGSWTTKTCSVSETNNTFIYMGENIDRSARGNVYIRTDSQYPFGIGPAGLEPAVQRPSIVPRYRPRGFSLFRRGSTLNPNQNA